MYTISRPRLAVIGSGISGLGAAWLLQHRYHVTLYEADSRFGGHTNTVEVADREGSVSVDTGFIVYNEGNYPHLTALFRHLGVATQASDMSFAVSVRGGELEYSGDSFSTLFAQGRNLVRPRHWRMLGEILRFHARAKADLAGGLTEALSLGAYLDQAGFGRELREDYLLPMAAAIWSCPSARMLGFPAASFLRFFANHGLLDLSDRPMWRTVSGGSREYVRRMLSDFRGNLRGGERVVAVNRDRNGVEIVGSSGHRARYEQVVFACHADQALAMLAEPDEREVEALGKFEYQANTAVLHSDTALMPQRRRVWASWNYLGDSAQDAVSVSYWMNRLQRLPTATPMIVSLNPLRTPDPRTVHYACRYAHPVFSEAACSAQQDLADMQGLRRSWYCGSYMGYGFHEDGLRSAVTVARALGAHIPWLSAKSAHAPVGVPVTAKVEA